MSLISTQNNLSVNLNGINLYYDESGEGKVPVIFIHGFPFDKSMWRPQLEGLDTSFRLIAYDIRGFGRSKDEKSEFTMDLFADDLILFMDQLEISQAVVCGLSMGGYIALNAAARFPERFRALILSDTQCIADSEEAREKRYKTIDSIKANGISEFSEGFIKNVFSKNSHENKKDLVDELKHVVDSNTDQIIIQGLKAIAKRAETCSSLEKIKAPTLILCGNEDVVTPPAQAENLHKLIRGSQLEIIENAGHVSNLEQPVVFNKLLNSFLTSLSV